MPAWLTSRFVPSPRLFASPLFTKQGRSIGMPASPIWISPFARQIPMSHGGLTSSSAYGSGFGEGSRSSTPNKEYAPPYSREASLGRDPHQQSLSFGGFGGKFGERSLQSGRSGADRGRARGGGGGRIPPGYAPSSGGGVEAALSSNAFASGHNQNCGNFITGRPSSRVTAPPGGHSTFSLG